MQNIKYLLDQISVRILNKFISDGLFRIGFHEGVQGVWAGTIPSLILVSQPTLKFTIYEFLKRHYLESYGNIIELN